jgi:putative FmdB family regulatory protein
VPIYEYACRSCGTSFEKRLKVEDRATPQVCPSCQTAGAELRMSVPAMVGAGASKSTGEGGYCPSTGQPCGCGHGVRH